jgi:hypothetical protein
VSFINAFKEMNAEDIDKVISQYGLLLKKNRRILPFSKLKDLQQS